ncbi:hypothetical protein [Legionella worsleiensis]|uniref:DUF4189 domain-containing protein n=1 Tax=Legionella worsleiensis TaxID=45076 RepID=A0A0W1A697_9GAMM|nr:hypothetical protein [Legionella worsleiensis]KTD76875.1 hypothetical protein Lwor_2100 [Legionella worsleiensis]STY33455.1 Uncharacterised protein [Legionella worsleiensis]
MNYCVRCFLVLLWVSYSGISISANADSSYWQCITQDKTNKQWTVKNTYQKVALNQAFALCKKESEFPTSCKTSQSSCEGFYMGMSTKPLWRCSAIDQTATAWNSNFYSEQDDAALAAKAYCKEYSSVPDTCFINFVTCKNYNEGLSLP